MLNDKCNNLIRVQKIECMNPVEFGINPYKPPNQKLLLGSAYYMLNLQSMWESLGVISYVCSEHAHTPVVYVYGIILSPVYQIRVQL